MNYTYTLTSKNAPQFLTEQFNYSVNELKPLYLGENYTFEIEKKGNSFSITTNCPYILNTESFQWASNLFNTTIISSIVENESGEVIEKMVYQPQMA